MKIIREIDVSKSFTKDQRDFIKNNKEMLVSRYRYEDAIYLITINSIIERIDFPEKWCFPFSNNELVDKLSIDDKKIVKEIKDVMELNLYRIIIL